MGYQQSTAGCGSLLPPRSIQCHTKFWPLHAWGACSSMSNYPPSLILVQTLVAIWGGSSSVIQLLSNFLKVFICGVKILQLRFEAERFNYYTSFFPSAECTNPSYHSSSSSSLLLFLFLLVQHFVSCRCAGCATEDSHLPLGGYCQNQGCPSN